jgi:Skp family chaperone for outer membrane proteins
MAGRLLIITIVICTFVSLCYCQEQTEKLDSKLEFIFGGGTFPYHRTKDAPPAIVPTHCAEIIIEWYHNEPVMDKDLEELVKVSAVKTVSDLQRDFLKTREATSFSLHHSEKATRNFRAWGQKFSYDYGRNYYFLYAVSVDDAKKMAEAFTEVFLEENNKILKPILESFINKYKDGRNRYQKLVHGTKTDILTKEEELKKLRTELDKLEDRTYYQSPDQAQKAMLELSSKLHAEEIELAGMLAKRKAIDQHRNRVNEIVQGTAEGGTNIVNWEPILINLEQKYIDVMIDLEVAQDRLRTAERLRYEVKSFLDKLSEVFETEDKIGSLKSNLEDYEGFIRQIETILAEPRPEMLPLKVDENKVPIYPVEIKTDE